VPVRATLSCCTMAEDMDLTWRLRRAGWRVETANDAIGLTEAPDTLKAYSDSGSAGRMVHCSACGSTATRWDGMASSAG